MGDASQQETSNAAQASAADADHIGIQVGGPAHDPRRGVPNLDRGRGFHTEVGSYALRLVHDLPPSLTQTTVEGSIRLPWLMGPESTA
jgi:hypothetical protein